MSLLLRPTLGPTLQPLTAAPIASTPATGTTWDPAHTRDLTLSVGNTVATSSVQEIGAVRGTTSKNSGKRRLRFVPVFSGTAADSEVLVGVGPDSFDPVDGVGAARYLYLTGYGLYADGTLYAEGVSSALGITFASGEAVFCDVDYPAGKGWFDTIANAYAVDREAGTNPHFNFTPNSALWPGAEVYANDETPSASVTLDCTASSGTFAANDS